MSRTIPDKVFEQRARNLGATDFRKEGRDWKLSFGGVDLTYMVTHGKHTKGNEVPIGGNLGIDHLANRMADVAKRKHFPNQDVGFYKKVLKGYIHPKKQSPRLEDYFLILMLFFIGYLMVIKVVF